MNAHPTETLFNSRGAIFGDQYQKFTPSNHAKTPNPLVVQAAWEGG
jgi:hypothetical protein